MDDFVPKMVGPEEQRRFGAHGRADRIRTLNQWIKSRWRSVRDCSQPFVTVGVLALSVRRSSQSVAVVCLLGHQNGHQSVMASW